MADTQDNTGLVQFDLVSPESRLVSQQVAMVVIPGEEGHFGVLAGHMPLISTIRHGVVAVHHTANDDHVDHYFIDGGFADVSSEQCTVLAEHAMKLPEIDQNELADEIKELHEAIQHIDNDDELRAAQRKLNVALSKQEAISWHGAGKR